MVEAILFVSASLCIVPVNRAMGPIAVKVVS